MRFCVFCAGQSVLGGPGRWGGREAPRAAGVVGLRAPARQRERQLPERRRRAGRHVRRRGRGAPGQGYIRTAGRRPWDVAPQKLFLGPKYIYSKYIFSMRVYTIFSWAPDDILGTPNRERRPAVTIGPRGELLVCGRKAIWLSRDSGLSFDELGRPPAPPCLAPSGLARGLCGLQPGAALLRDGATVLAAVAGTSCANCSSHVWVYRGRLSTADAGAGTGTVRRTALAMGGKVAFVPPGSVLCGDSRMEYRPSRYRGV